MILQSMVIVLDPYLYKTDNDYWRGRIWAPMNFLVYIGLRRYNGTEFTTARSILATQSKMTLLRTWKQLRHIQENYNHVTGDGCDVWNADPFYHWYLSYHPLILIIDRGS